MCRCTQQQALRVGKQRAEVRHRADAHEDQGRVDACLDTDIEKVKQAGMTHDVAVAVIVRAGGIQKGFPQLRMVQGIVSAQVYHKEAQVAQQAAERYAAQKQRFKLFHDPEIEQHKRYHDHDQVLPAAGHEERGKARFQSQRFQGI